MDTISFISGKNRKKCEICGKEFTPKISAYTLEDDKGRKVYLCSYSCKEKYLEKDRPVQKCDQCGKEFRVVHNYQTLKLGKAEYYLCSTECQGNFISDIKRKAREASGLNKATDTTRKIIIYTQKGGTGKTTTALNVSVALSQMGFRVLLIDGDPQGNISISLKLKDTNKRKNLYHVFSDNTSIKDVICKNNEGLNNLDLLLSDQNLAAVNINLVKYEDMKNRHKVFAQKLKEVEKQYDYIITDSSPALSVLNQNLLYAADEIIIPASCDYLSFATVEKVMETIKDVEKFYKHKIDILGILPTLFISGRRISKRIVKALQTKYGPSMVLAPIRDRAGIRAASFDGVAVVLSPKLQGYHEYQALAQTISDKKRIKNIKRYN